MKLFAHKAERATGLCAVAASAVAILVLYVQPQLIGVYVTQLGFSEKTAGLLAAVEMGGFTVGALLMYAMLRWSPRRVLVTAIALLSGFNIAAVFVESQTALAILRFGAGTGGGLIMTVTILVIGGMQTPTPVFGLWTAGQTLLGALGAALWPSTAGVTGAWLAFAVFAALALLLLPTLPLYPQRFVEPQASDSDTSAHMSAEPGAWVCLLGIFVAYSGQMGVWAYLERLGAGLGFGPAQIGTALSLSLLAGFAGSGVAMLAGARYGQMRPLIGSLLLTMLTLSFLLRENTLLLYALAICAFNFAIYVFVPFASALIAELDSGGRHLTALGVVLPASLAAGPALAALLVVQGDPGPALVSGIVCAIIGLLACISGTRLARRH